MNSYELEKLYAVYIFSFFITVFFLFFIFYFFIFIIIVVSSIILIYQWIQLNEILFLFFSCLLQKGKKENTINSNTVWVSSVFINSFYFSIWDGWHSVPFHNITHSWCGIEMNAINIVYCTLFQHTHTHTHTHCKEEKRMKNNTKLSIQHKSLCVRLLPC